MCDAVIEQWQKKKQRVLNHMKMEEEIKLFNEEIYGEVRRVNFSKKHLWTTIAKEFLNYPSEDPSYSRDTNNNGVSEKNYNFLEMRGHLGIGVGQIKKEYGEHLFWQCIEWYNEDLIPGGGQGKFRSMLRRYFQQCYDKHIDVKTYYTDKNTTKEKEGTIRCINLLKLNYGRDEKIIFSRHFIDDIIKD